MNIKETIKRKIDTLIALEMTKGVQPSELADNIFLEDYVEFNLYKKDKNIFGEITFIEEHAESSFKVKLVYIYDQNKELIKIEENILKQVTTIWDRESQEKLLVNQIVSLFRELEKPNEALEFINKLPGKLKGLVNTSFNNIKIA